MSANGAMSDKETEALRKAAERPIDQDPLFSQQAQQLREAKADVTRLSARNTDLEHRSKLLEESNGRFAVIALQGGVKIATGTQISAAIPQLSDTEVQDLILELTQESKKRAEKKKSKRLDTIAKAAGNGKRT